MVLNSLSPHCFGRNPRWFNSSSVHFKKLSQVKLSVGTTKMSGGQERTWDYFLNEELVTPGRVRDLVRRFESLANLPQRRPAATVREDETQADGSIDAEPPKNEDEHDSNTVCYKYEQKDSSRKEECPICFSEFLDDQLVRLVNFLSTFRLKFISLTKTGSFKGACHVSIFITSLASTSGLKPVLAVLFVDMISSLVMLVRTILEQQTTFRFVSL